MPKKTKTTGKHLAEARKVFKTEIDSLQAVAKGLDESFDKSIALIRTALRKGGKVVITGIGKNLPIAEKIASTLASTGTRSVVLNPVQAMHGDLGILRADDILIALSYSGESDELNALLPSIKQMKIKTIAITGVKNSCLAKHSNLTILAPVKKEACPFNMAPTTSTTAALVIGDALAIALMKARGFDKNDYVRLHPGGAIGRTLSVKVSDIMRTGRRLAKVKKTDTVKSAMLAMTSSRSGSVGIVDAKQKLLGIVTDGDLRRHLLADIAILDAPVSKIMTKSPSTVNPDQLISEVLSIFETHSFDDLLVVDGKGKLVGYIDIQDLPKLKIL
jgi:arabinose-5-phosphate isomerase